MSESTPSARRFKRSAAGLLLGLVLVSLPVLAHKLQVFAFAEGARIQGSAYFAGGAKASGARIRIQDASGKTLAELTPDTKGAFSYQATSPTDHIVIAESGDGHRAEWRVTADELAGGFPQSELVASAPNEEQPNTGNPPPPIQTSATPEPTQETSAPIPDARLLMDIEQAVARQVRPLREQLIASEDRARWHDVLGGIGYIIGLTGLALWMHARSKGGCS
ncbi:hypothetical protein [Thiorhodococcus fuscus]|uniref:Carboxypeptidase regulatory-like domain-containing protein n=1 Tax=Thiorhodococcus fuscus TaxID=527200 RepID=A0ABW4Y723_9GAMM